MKSRLLGILVLSAILAACTNKSDGKVPATPNFDLTPPSGKSTGAFTSARSDADAVKEAYYCKFGPGENSYNIDEKLQAGMKYELSERWLAVEGGYSGRGHVNIEIQSVDRTSMTLQSRYSFIDFPAWYEYQCKLLTTSEGMKCEVVNLSENLKGYNDEGPKKFGKSQSRISTAQYCWVIDGEITPESKYEVGTYTLPNGKTVAALRMLEFRKGTVKCANAEIGQGTSVSEVILSGEVANPEINCGSATKLFTYDQVKDASGKVVSEQQEEILNF